MLGVHEISTRRSFKEINNYIGVLYENKIEHRLKHAPMYSNMIWMDLKGDFDIKFE